MTLTTNFISGAINTVSKPLSRAAAKRALQKIALNTAPATIVYEPRSLKLLARHIKNSIQHAFFTRLYDLPNLRFNLMAASSLILVTCRSVVANSTARKAKGTSQEVYRYQEAVKTTFREFLTFAMTYVVLMYAQRFVVDAFRNILWVRKGVTRMPTIFNPLLQKWCHVPEQIRNNLKNEIGPTMSSSFNEIIGHIHNYRKGRQVAPLSKMTLRQNWIQSEALNSNIEIDSANRKQQYDFVYRTFIKPIALIANQDLKVMTQEQTLKMFFEWAPPLLGAIPAIILSGFYSEMATQKYAEPFARFIANLRSKKKTTPAPIPPYTMANPSFKASSNTPLWTP